ncbi:unnamed protein product [Adineta steineri]|uniref:Uncharacterized protein n=1 Tax=Adineta steineri TaxID=433720 RepID=A0A818RZ45_9BILA|nr:unnamed protein product [Adineta steineri]CAF3664331.1 unnamed protein product [Adineta steineri]CAF3844967.1 unnamed protein product [Adineta steineri]
MERAQSRSSSSSQSRSPSPSRSRSPSPSPSSDLMAKGAQAPALTSEWVLQPEHWQGMVFPVKLRTGWRCDKSTRDELRLHEKINILKEKENGHSFQSLSEKFNISLEAVSKNLKGNKNTQMITN